jgi:membrane protein required for colicin V production
MNWVDYTIIGIIAVSALISVTRGFVREVLSLIAWVAAFWVALTFSQQAADYIQPYVHNETLREVTAFVALFLGTLIIVALINYLIAQIIERTGISGTDIMLGMVFGIVRGVIIVVLLVLLASLTSFPQEPWWNHSMLMPHFVQMAKWVRGYLPEDVKRNFNLEQGQAARSERLSPRIQSNRIPPVIERSASRPTESHGGGEAGGHPPQ